MVKFLTHNNQEIKRYYDGDNLNPLSFEDIKYLANPSDTEKLLLNIDTTTGIALKTDSTMDVGKYWSYLGLTNNTTYIVIVYSYDDWSGQRMYEPGFSNTETFQRLSSNSFIIKFDKKTADRAGVNNASGESKYIDYIYYYKVTSNPTIATNNNISKVYRGSELIWENPIKTIRETTTESVPFTTTYYDDPNRDVGTQATTTPGVNGVRTIVWDITYRNSSEIGRVRVSDSVTTQPITQRVARGVRPIGATLISRLILYGPTTITNTAGTTFTNMYYVNLTEPIIVGKTYRAVITRPDSVGAILWTEDLRVWASAASHTNTWQRTFISAHTGVNRVYAENASVIRVYRMD